jgi:DNA-binding NtrC family response regulator
MRKPPQGEMTPRQDPLAELEQALRARRIPKLGDLADVMIDLKLGLHGGQILVTQAIIMRALERNRGNQCATARELGIHRNTLARHLDDQPSRAYTRNGRAA